MYEKMFAALDPNGEQAIEPGKGVRGSTEELFNNTNMSFGKEFQQIHKQVQHEMQERITELEEQLRSKD